MADYRANAVDVAQDTADAEVKIKFPVLSLWGVDFVAGGKLFDMPKVWGEMAENLMAVAIPRCGHLPHARSPASARSFHTSRCVTFRSREAARVQCQLTPD